MRTFDVRVETERLPLSNAAIRALGNLDHYDCIVFTSKNARAFFMQELRERGIRTRTRMIQVGPRKELLKLPLKYARVLFPRSDIAPADILHDLRARGARVRVIRLYTTYGVILTPAERSLMLRGQITQFYFKSPSGITGLLQQWRGKERQQILRIPALCIGETTASAAQRAGFRQVSIA